MEGYRPAVFFRHPQTKACRTPGKVADIAEGICMLACCKVEDSRFLFKEIRGVNNFLPVDTQFYRPGVLYQEAVFTWLFDSEFAVEYQGKVVGIVGQLYIDGLRIAGAGYIFWCDPVQIIV